MDLLTQGVLGAVLAQTVSSKTETRIATAIGFISGLAADADILIRSSSDPLLTLEYHRHFTHSIFFIPFGALFVAVLLWPVFRRKTSFKQIYLYSLLGYMLSGFLDVCTSYGTYLLWPLYNEPIAFRIISIIDPVFTLILLFAAVVTFKIRKVRPAFIGLVLAGTYLLFGLIQSYRAGLQIEQLAELRGHIPEKMMVKPTIGNLFLWRGVYQHDGYFYIDAVRTVIESQIFEGGRVKIFKAGSELGYLPDGTVLSKDINRFSVFSHGYIARHPNNENIIGDIRYSMLPNSTIPLWGIEIDLERPEMHVKYHVFRDASERVRKQYFSMLFN